jgi:UTP-glucose-1-phosphate uridylyltransferase
MSLKSDAGVFDRGNKKGFLSANLAVGMLNPETKQHIKALI